MGPAAMPMISDAYHDHIPETTGVEDILKEQDRHNQDRRDLFLLVLELERGNVSKACQIIGAQRSTYNQWCLDYHEFRDRCQEIQESLFDMAEGKLLDNVEGGQQRAIEFYLECRAKDRGYVKRREVTGDGGGPIKVIGELPREQIELLQAAAKQGARQEVARLYEGETPALDGEVTEITDSGEADGS